MDCYWFSGITIRAVTSENNNVRYLKKILTITKHGFILWIVRYLKNERS